MATYGYDFTGRRISKTISGPTTTTYVYDGDQVIAEYNGSTCLRKFIYGPGIDEPLIMIDVASGDLYWYHYDGLGSVVALSKYDSGDTYASIVERYSYDVFGVTTIHGAGPDEIWGNGDDTTPSESDFGNPYMFTGRRFDPETGGVYYYRARLYVPAIGRFLQPDPIGYADSMNLYQYCGNNPINFVDPYGLISPSMVLEIAKYGELMGLIEKGREFTQTGDKSCANRRDYWFKGYQCSEQTTDLIVFLKSLEPQFWSFGEFGRARGVYFYRGGGQQAEDRFNASMEGRDRNTPWFVADPTRLPYARKIWRSIVTNGVGYVWQHTVTRVDPKDGNSPSFYFDNFNNYGRERGKNRKFKFGILSQFKKDHPVSQ